MKQIENVGEKLKLLRIRRGMEQAELAERCGISQSYISKMERQSVLPSIEVISKLAEVLNVDEQYFFNSYIPKVNDISNENFANLVVYMHHDNRSKQFLSRAESVPLVELLSRMFYENGLRKDELEALQLILKSRKRV